MSSLLMPTYWHQLKICWQYCLRKQITHICSERLKACINCWQIYRIFAFIKYFLFQEMVETSVQTFHLNGNLTLLENDVHKKTGRYKPWLHSTYCFPTSCWSTLLSLCLGTDSVYLCQFLYLIVLMIFNQYLNLKDGLIIVFLLKPVVVCLIRYSCNCHLIHGIILLLLH